ncbi:MAG TPA: LLM class flavin-dependent oxidoreductase [Thermoanaerobaculia bacterium]
MSAVKFHWRLAHGSEGATVSRAYIDSLEQTGMPDLEYGRRFCKRAEELGIDSLLTAFDWSRPDPMFLAAGLGLATERIKFIIAYRSGLICPTSFVQQLNTLSAMIGGRFSLNIVAGEQPEEQRCYGDWLPHDERYARATEFLAICRALWRREEPVNFEGRYYKVAGAKINTPFVAPDRTFPEIFVAGHSRAAEELALRQGTIWIRMAETPQAMAAKGSAVLAAGKELGVRCAIIGGRTRGEALKKAYALVAEKRDGFDDRAAEREFMRKTDSVNIRATYELADTEWLAPWLWTGAVRTHGAPSVAIIGSPREIADGIEELMRAGITQFIFGGWPKLEAMEFFGEEVLPLVREPKELASRAGGGSAMTPILAGA